MATTNPAVPPRPSFMGAAPVSNPNQLNTGLLAGRSLEQLRAQNQATRAAVIPAPAPVQGPAPMVVTSAAANQNINRQMNLVQQTQAQMQAQQQAQAQQKAAQATLPTQGQVAPTTNSQGLTVAQMIAAANAQNPQQAVAQQQASSGVSADAGFHDPSGPTYATKPGVGQGIQLPNVMPDADADKWGVPRGSTWGDAYAKAKGDLQDTKAAGGATTAPGAQTPAGGTTTTPDGTQSAGGQAGGTPTTGNAETDAYIRQTQETASALDRASAEHQGLIGQMLNGSIPLTPDQTAMMNSITQQFQQQVEDQKQANLAYQAGIERAGIASGRNIYSPEVHMANVNSAISKGIRDISKINMDMVSAVTKANIAYKESNYALLDKSYEKLEQAIKDRQEVIDKTHKAAQEALDENHKRFAEDLEIKKYNHQLDQDLQKPILEADAKLKDYLFEQVKLHPDAGITSDDTVDSATKKIIASDSYKADQARKKAELEQTQAETYKIQHPATKGGGGGGSGSGSGLTVTPGTGDTSKLSARAKQVYDNPSLLNSYTATEKGKILDEFAKAGVVFDAGGLEKVGAGQRDQIAKYDGIISQADRAAELVGMVNTGPVAGRTQEALAAVGKASPEFVAYRSAIADMSSVLLNLRSGAAVSPSEYDRIKGFIPTIYDDERTAARKINLFRSAIAQARETYINRATQTTSQIKSSTKAEDYSAAKSQLQKGEILVRDNKSGQIGAISESEMSKDYTKL